MKLEYQTMDKAPKTLQLRMLYTTIRILYDLVVWLVRKSGGPALHSCPPFYIFLNNNNTNSTVYARFFINLGYTTCFDPTGSFSDVASCTLFTYCIVT
jgi:hypothetical protein